MGNKGIIYILKNQYMQGIIKIGMTENEDVIDRAKQLYTSGVPVPFDVYYAAYVDNVRMVEKSLHNGFTDHRVNSKREFFDINPERVIAMLQMVNPKQIDANAIDKAIAQDSKMNEEIIKPAKKPNFSFSMVGLKEGDELSFTRDENIKVQIVDGNPNSAKNANWVKYNGEIYSITGLAKKLLNTDNTHLAGINYWMHDGKTLDEMRSEKEEQEEYDE